MDLITYERLRDQAIEGFTKELRIAFDRVFESFEAEKAVSSPRPLSRLSGLKFKLETCLNSLLEHGVETFVLDDVIETLRGIDFSLANRIATNPAKKASASSIMKRLANKKQDGMIEILEAGQGSRPTRYRFTRAVLARQELMELRALDSEQQHF
jgi:hypothetical protein